MAYCRGYGRTEGGALGSRRLMIGAAFLLFWFVLCLFWMLDFDCVSSYLDTIETTRRSKNLETLDTTGLIVLFRVNRSVQKR